MLQEKRATAAARVCSPITAPCLRPPRARRSCAPTVMGGGLSRRRRTTASLAPSPHGRLLCAAVVARPPLTPRHRAAYGALPTRFRGRVCPTRPTSMRQEAPYYWSILLTMGWETMCVHHTYITKNRVTTSNHSRRQKHYNPPILDSTQSPQLGRTTNNQLPGRSQQEATAISLYYIRSTFHLYHMIHDAMIQRQSPTSDLRGGFMKAERTLTRA